MTDDFEGKLRQTRALRANGFPFQNILISVSTKSKFHFARVLKPFFRFPQSQILTNSKIIMKVNESRIKAQRRGKNEESREEIIKKEH